MSRFEKLPYIDRTRLVHAILLYISLMGMTQKDFALEVGITDNHLSKILRGKHNPSMKLIVLMYHIVKKQYNEI